MCGSEMSIALEGERAAQSLESRAASVPLETRDHAKIFCRQRTQRTPVALVVSITRTVTA
jgi:hypothetical protein